LVKLQPLRLRRYLPARLAALPGPAATTATTTTSGPEASAASAMSATLHLRAGFVDVQRTATEIKPVQGGNSTFRFG
jgi:hypothetical protein